MNHRSESGPSNNDDVVSATIYAMALRQLSPSYVPAQFNLHNTFLHRSGLGGPPAGLRCGPRLNPPGPERGTPILKIRPSF